MIFSAWKKIALTVIALFIYGLTSFSPVLYSIPSYIQMNIVTVLILTLIWGGPMGILFVALVSIVNNNLANGGGVVMYALLTKIFEVVLIAAINWKQNYTLLKAGITSCLLIILVKPINILLYQWLGNKAPLDMHFVAYFKAEYLFFLKYSLKNYSLMVFFSCVLTWLILKIFFFRNKKLCFNCLGGIKVCSN